MTHELKTWPEYYKMIVSGDKTFTGNEVTVEVTYVFYGNVSGKGIMAGYCIMAIKL